MRALLTCLLASSLAGCLVSHSKPRTASGAQPATTYKNHGQQRSQEVHERNAERKAERDAAKGKK
jgi:hypothetical protein